MNEEWLFDWELCDRQMVMGWMEECLGIGIGLGYSLPDTLITTAQSLGMIPAELRMWIYSAEKHDWSADTLGAFARRLGYDRVASDDATSS